MPFIDHNIAMPSIPGPGQSPLAALSPAHVEQWRELMRTENVPVDLATSQLQIIQDSKLERFGLTQAQRELPTREYLGRGIESLVILPGETRLNDALISKSIALVSATFPSDESVPADERPVATWERSIRKRIAGDAYFVETDPGLEGRIGVFDAFFAYLARRDPAVPLAAEELPDSKLIGIHGVYRYLVEPTVFYGVRLAVDPELQGQGIGTMMMSHNLQQCIRLGGTERRVFTEADPVHNKRALDMYSRWGFTPTDRSFEYNGKRQVVLSASLTPGTNAWRMARNFDRDSGLPVSSSISL